MEISVKMTEQEYLNYLSFKLDKENFRLNIKEKIIDFKNEIREEIKNSDLPYYKKEEKERTISFLCDVQNNIDKELEQIKILGDKKTHETV